jgi:predicted nucleic acid-binding Zn ribbon protein
MTDQNEQFRRIIRSRSEKKSGKTAKLGDVAEQLMNKRISPRQAKFGPVVEAWNQLLPAELREHCTIASVSSSQVRVVADSPSYVHELRLCSSELLEQLQRQCPAARITKIKVGVG